MADAWLGYASRRHPHHRKDVAMATVKELQAQASDLDIKGRSSMDKAALEEAIAEQAAPEVTSVEPGAVDRSVRTDADLPGRSEAADRARAVAAASEGGASAETA